MESKEENNRIIAEFMGLTWDEHDEAWTDGKYAKYDLLRYSSSWDWLMPVVLKVGSLTTNKNPKLWGDIALALQAVDMDWIYRGVVDYILWYNKQTLKR